MADDFCPKCGAKLKTVPARIPIGLDCSDYGTQKVCVGKCGYEAEPVLDTKPGSSMAS